MDRLTCAVTGLIGRNPTALEDQKRPPSEKPSIGSNTDDKSINIISRYERESGLVITSFTRKLLGERSQIIITAT